MLDCRAADHEIKTEARWQAGRVRSYVASIPRNSNTVFSAVWPTTPEGISEDLARIARDANATPITGKKCSIAGTIARMIDPAWWTRNLRRATLREHETQARAAGEVTRNKQLYLSDHAVKVKAERDKANRLTLEGLEVVNEQGEAFNLQDIADKSVSNPKIRRAELMTRARGFEEAAEFMGHTAYFLTLTCPARFHRKDKNGYDVKKWRDMSPKDGQEYLCTVWARTRAAWAKNNITVYGFRVAEPNQDGTPHWHLLLFVPGAQVKDMLTIAHEHAHAENRGEAGAKKHRFTAKRIDTTKGSATGYIAKYICKNIDGTKEDGTPLENSERDSEHGPDTSANHAAQRVRNWASTWGIRQFQQIGGPSVTVWRELRRLGKDAETLQLELFEKPRAAAVRGDWMAFWLVQGGPEVARKDLSLKPFYMSDDLGKYGDMTPKIKGVTGKDATGEYLEVTRKTAWTVQRAGAAAQDAAQWAWADKLDFNRTNATFLEAYKDVEFQRIGEAERTRTGINNCRNDPPATFDFSSFEPDESPEIYATGEPRMGFPEDQADVIAHSLEEMANYPDLSESRYRISATH